MLERLRLQLVAMVISNVCSTCRFLHLPLSPRSQSADELLTVATGKPLDPTIFLAYITKKYKDIYQLP